MLRKLWICAAKEVRVILRDREALAILFAMPIAFVIIMSLALQDFFRQGSAPQFDLVLLDGDQGAVAKAVVNGVEALPYFRVERRVSDDFPAAQTALRAQVSRGETRFALILPPGLTGESSANGELTLLTDPALRSDHRILARTALQNLLTAIDVQRVQAQMTRKAFDPDMFRGQRAQRGGLRIAEDEQAASARSAMPSATQQNVPAYSLLAMFLLVVPLSATFIKEREQGSLLRLESMPVPAGVVIGGKMLPYLIINLLQVALCFAVGFYVLPLLGGEALRLGSSLVGIVVLSLAASLAAIGFGLLVALFSRTTEQATAFGATAILLLAALGGIMVPKMLMPASLQAVAAYSPLGWALDGYLDLFVRDAGLMEVLPRVGYLLAFAAACFAVAMWRFSTRAHLR